MILWRPVGFLIAAIIFGATMPAVAEDRELAALQWKKRVLVAIAPSAQNERLEAQRRTIHASKSGMVERDIAFFEFTTDDARSRAVRKQFSVGGKEFKIILLGKDGHIALTSAAPLSAETLFGTIDAMPMRKDEMRRQRSEK